MWHYRRTAASAKNGVNVLQTNRVRARGHIFYACRDFNAVFFESLIQTRGRERRSSLWANVKCIIFLRRAKAIALRLSQGQAGLRSQILYLNTLNNTILDDVTSSPSSSLLCSLLLDPLFSSLPISFPLLHSLHLSPHIFTSGLQSSLFSSPHLLWPPLFFFSPSPLLSTRLVSSSISFIIISVIKRHIHFYCESRKSSLPPAESAGLLWWTCIFWLSSLLHELFLIERNNRFRRIYATWAHQTPHRGGKNRIFLNSRRDLKGFS